MKKRLALLIAASTFLLSGCILPPIDGGNGGYGSNTGPVIVNPGRTVKHNWRWCLNHNRKCKRHHHNLWCRVNGRCGR